ncbi:alpha/beta hydrolase [Acidaminococcus massiliensis]|uniref:alpha/beta hydrolase n=1 Tax=Acidaminococcus massiliensis TaxID=1852375 RepID=UPI0018E24B9B
MPAPRYADHGADNFYKSSKVTMKPVTFKNQFNMKVAGNLYIPKTYQKGQKLPAVIVGHPMGAVKEQSGTLYAQKIADQGFVTLAVDTPYWGSSEGTPRNSVLPDIYSEAYMAAVDYLGTRDFVDRDNIGALGVCGSGSFIISAAKIDPRIKAIATVSMYNMGAANRDGLHHSQTLEQREAYIADAARQRYAEFEGEPRKLLGGTTHTLNEQTDPIQQEFYDFYRTTRGAAAGKGQDMNTTTHPTYTSNVKFMNFYPFQDIETISPRPLLFITGDQAHSREFSEDAYRRAKGPKELYYVKGAGHVDLYDKTELIPFDKITSFFSQYLHLKK